MAKRTGKKSGKRSEKKMAVHQSSIVGFYETDPELFALLNKEFKFELDLYASKNNALCDLFFSLKRPAEEMTWFRYAKRAYGNPTYGRGMLKTIQHAVEQAKKMDVVVLLVPARVDTRWFRFVAENGVVNLLPGRQSFYIDGEPALVWSRKQKKYVHCKAPFPSAIVVMGKRVKTPRIKLWSEGEKFLPKALRS